MMLHRIWPRAALLITLLLPLSARAETVFIAGTAKSSGVEVPLDPSMAGKVLAIYAAAPKAPFQNLDFSITGLTGGEIITVESATVAGKQDPLAAVQKGTTPSLIYTYTGYKKQLTIPKTNSQGGGAAPTPTPTPPPMSTPAGGDPNCACLSETEIAQYLYYYQIAYPGATREQMCAKLPKIPGGVCPTSGGGGGTGGTGGSGGSDPVSYNSAAGSAFLAANRCVAASKAVAVVKIDLSKVDAAALTNAKLTVVTNFRSFHGSMKATMKLSDGRWRHVNTGWILLTGAVHVGDDTVKMIRWHGNRATVTQLKTVGVIAYGGTVLTEALFTSLPGGKGTFEVTSGMDGYEYGCPRFIRQRQNFNGYKKLG